MYTRGCAGERLIHLFRVILAVARGRDKFLLLSFKLSADEDLLHLGNRIIKLNEKDDNCTQKI